MLSPRPRAPPGQGNLCRPKQSVQPLARRPKGCFPSPQFQLTQQSLHPSRGGGLREAFAIRVPIASFPLPSEWKRQPQGSPWEHLPPPQRSALDAPRRPQRGTASTRGPSPPPTALTPSYSPGRKRLVSGTRPAPAWPQGLPAPQELRWGQGLPDHRKPPVTSSKGAGSGESLRACSASLLTNQ